MTYEDLVAYFKTEAKAGAARGLSRQTVHRWKGRTIPLDQQVEYEVVTNGGLRADLPDSVRSPIEDAESHSRRRDDPHPEVPG